jgi:RNA polymerase sigma-70 factor, ECF subfamily
LSDQAKSPVTTLLGELRNGRREAFNELVSAVYTDLRKMAARHMRQERHATSLQTTALVHEMWLRLLPERERGWENREHFFYAAGRAMRHLLVERARKRRALRRGGDYIKVPLDDVDPHTTLRSAQLIRLDDILETLAKTAPDDRDLVELRYFAGQPLSEIARLRGMPLIAVKRQWQVLRAFLFRELSEVDDDQG